MGVPARRPFGVAPTAFPSRIVSAQEKPAGDHIAAAGRRVLFDEPGEYLGNPGGPFIAARITPAVSVGLLQHEPFAWGVGEVGGKERIEFTPSHSLLVDDALLDRGERIGHRRQGGRVDAHVVELDAAVADVAALLDRPVAKEVQHQLRLVFPLVIQMEIDSLRRAEDGAAEVVDEAIPKRIERRGSVLVERLAPGDLEDLGRVDFHKVVERVLAARDRHPVAADGNPLPSQFFGISIPGEPLDQRLIPGETRPALAVFQEMTDTRLEQVFVQSVVDADGEIARGLQPVGGFPE